MKITNMDCRKNNIVAEFDSNSGHHLTLVLGLERFKDSFFDFSVETEYYLEYEELEPAENYEVADYLNQYFTADEQMAIVNMRNALESVLKTEDN